MKLGELFAIADKLGADKVATGHYARVDDEGRLYAGRDATKDQSYFLYATPTALLERLMFPLGESTKDEVRAEAVARKLPGATKGESQELCFVGEGAGAYAKFVEERAKDRLRPGPIVDETGRVVGAHDGIHRFTVGQRKGLGVALGGAAFVTRIDAKDATVHVGTKTSLRATRATLRDVVLAPDVTLPREALARVRYRHEGVRARAEGRRRSSSSTPAGAVAPGQVAVLYDGDRVLGGGIIVGGDVMKRVARIGASARSRVDRDVATANGCTVGSGTGSVQRRSLRAPIAGREIRPPAGLLRRRRPTRTTTRSSSASSAAATTSTSATAFDPRHARHRGRERRSLRGPANALGLAAAGRRAARRAHHADGEPRDVSSSRSTCSRLVSSRDAGPLRDGHRHDERRDAT